jgi:hypothetical protein
MADPMAGVLKEWANSAPRMLALMYGSEIFEAETIGAFRRRYAVLNCEHDLGAITSQSLLSYRDDFTFVFHFHSRNNSTFSRMSSHKSCSVHVRCRNDPESLKVRGDSSTMAPRFVNSSTTNSDADDQRGFPTITGAVARDHRQPQAEVS